MDRVLACSDWLRPDRSLGDLQDRSDWSFIYKGIIKSASTADTLVTHQFGSHFIWDTGRKRLCWNQWVTILDSGGPGQTPGNPKGNRKEKIDPRKVRTCTDHISKTWAALPGFHQQVKTWFHWIWIICLMTKLMSEGWHDERHSRTTWRGRWKSVIY